MGSQTRQFPAHKARAGLDVLDPGTGQYGRVEGVTREQGITRIRLSGITGKLGIAVPDDRLLTFRRKRKN
jgi:hypothetical protein